ncbi:hypothetical protein [Bacillus cereus]|nr:hypothetical protein [Bacillus cereus]
MGYTFLTISIISFVVSK